MKPCRFLFALVCLAFCSAAFGQATTASLTGVVDDPSKAVIPKVSVAAINIDTGAKTQTFTNKEGIYVFPSLQTGNYRVEVDKQGFKGIIEAGLTLHVQDVLQLNFHMAVGSMSESVTVNASQPETTTATVSTVIRHEFIENMPLNGNDLTTLFELTPGTLLNAGPGGTPETGGGFSVDGQRATANYLTVDGANGDAYIPTQPGSSSNNTGSGIATSASGSTNGILPIDAIEEYRMDTATYTAENGRTPGGQIQVRTRSGTNQFHGTLFENFRNQVLDAEDWFTKYDDLTQSQLRMNEFGGTLGGPVVIPHLFDGRNKLFFFVANDNLVLNQPNTTIQSLVPDASVLTSAYPVFKTWLGVFPSGNGGQDPSIPSFDYYNVSSPNLIRDHTTSVRVDGQLPRSIHAFFRVNIAPSSSTAVSNSIQNNGSHISLDTYTGGLTIPIGSSMVDEVTANYTGDNTNVLSTIESSGGNNPNALLNNLPNGVTPLDNFVLEVGASSFSHNAEAQVGPENRNELHQWNVVDTFALNKGRNDLKFGVDFLNRQSILEGLKTEYLVGVSAGNDPPYTTAGIDTGEITFEELSYFAHPTISLSNTSLFVNDDWKPIHSLTLNAGVRWELNPAPTVGPLGTFAFVGDNTNPLTFQAALSTKALYQTRYNNFAPRFGFAWAPRPNSGMVVRGGVGIYFDTGQAAAAASTSASSSYPYENTQIASNVPYASISFAPLVGSPSFTPQYGLFLDDPHLLSPRTYEWSFTLDQTFGKYAKLTASYVGNDGERLIGDDLYYNDENAAGQYIVNTTYVRQDGTFYILTNQSHSNYQALQAQLTSRIGQRFTGLVSYTWSHAEDNGSSDFSSVGAASLNPIANSSNDIPQMFSAAVHYAPEGVKGNRILRAVTGGWGLDTIARLQSAAPITVTFSNTDADLNGFTTNADVIAGVPTVPHTHLNPYSGTVVPGNRLLNWAAFTSPPTDSNGNQLRNGDSPTNGYRLFGLKQWDLAASRNWKLWKELNLNFRVDAYNLLNTANFSSVSSSWYSSNNTTFGMAQSTYAGEYGASPGSFGAGGNQLAAFQNGGPRELQLSMKLKF